MTGHVPHGWAEDETSVARLLSSLRSWTPLDGGAVLDDVAAADECLDTGAAAVIAGRLFGPLGQLADIAVCGQVVQSSAYVGLLVQQARVLGAEPQATIADLPRLRRMAWIISELLDQLAALQVIKEAVAP